MKINEKQGPPLVSGHSQTKRPSGDPKESVAGDRLELSTISRTLTAAEDQTASSEIRAARVAEIREQIDAGTYDVTAKRIAQAMIKGNIVDEVV